MGDLQPLPNHLPERDSRETALDRFISRLQHRFHAGHTHGVTAVAIDGARGILASGSSDKTVKLWDLASGRELRTLEGHTREVTSLAIDGLRGILASGSNDGSLRLWSLFDQQFLAVLLAFRPDSWFVGTAEGYCDASSSELMEKVNHEVGDRFGRAIDPLIFDPKRVKEIFARRFGIDTRPPKTSSARQISSPPPKLIPDKQEE